jgi:hypothetical protein
MADVNPSLVSLSDHPRAARGIRTAKAAGGLVGFAVVAVGSWMHHTPLPDTLLRAVGGIGGNMLAWFGAIVVWQHMLEGEAVTAVRRAAAERRARAERAAAGN